MVRWKAIAAILIGVALLAVVPAALSKGGPAGNAPNAKACQKNGWTSLYTRQGEAFASETACTSYAARGGQLIKQGALVCLNSGWQTLGADASTAFTSEQACVDFANGGSTPVTVGGGADISLAYNETTHVVTVSNGGPQAAKVGVTVTAPGKEPDCYLGGFTYNGAVWAVVQNSGCSDTLNTLSAIASGASVGFTIDFALIPEGWAEVTSSTQPDPDSSNNKVTIPKFGEPS